MFDYLHRGLRQSQPKSSTGSRVVVGADMAAVKFHQLTANVQAKSGALFVSGRARGKFGVVLNFHKALQSGSAGIG